MMNQTQIATITLIEVKGWNAYLFLLKFPFIQNQLRKVKNIEFVKLLGTGSSNGFGKWINFTTFGFFAVWKTEKDANAFFEDHPLFSNIEHRSISVMTIFMKNIKAKGKWDNENPFLDFQPYQRGLIAVLTRAKIHWKSLWRFWEKVPKVSAELNHQEGLVFAIGLGEYPYLMQATFSIWKDLDAVKKYAYQNKFHQNAIHLTHKEKWYKEELFAQFIPYRSTGSWGNLESIHATNTQNVQEIN
jgi:hypothetical protein